MSPTIAHLLPLGEASAGVPKGTTHLDQHLNQFLWRPPSAGIMPRKGRNSFSREDCHSFPRLVPACGSGGFHPPMPGLPEGTVLQVPY